MIVNFKNIDKALSQLKLGTQVAPANDLERDGVIHRFEYTIELLWKVAKKVLQENGVTAVAPKDVIREMANINWIHNPKELINFLKMRNESSHSYKEEIAQLVYQASVDFTSVAEVLLQTLKEKSK